MTTGVPQAFIYDAIRTPRGRSKPTGGLHDVTPVALVAGLMYELHRRNPGLDPAQVEDVLLGVVTPVGDQGADIARTAAVVAGMQRSGPGVQLNRFCASGLEAVNTAAAKIRAGWADLILAGGVESMSRVPMGSDGGAWANDPETAQLTGFVPQGISADLIATLEGFSREDVDAFAVESQIRTAKAQADGAFSRSLVPVLDRTGQLVLDHDEHPRSGTTLESLAGLPPAFATAGQVGGFDAVAQRKYPRVERIAHVHTAGNSSGIVDGAALLIIGSERMGVDLGLVPRARIVSTGVVAEEPTIMLTGPAPSARLALARAGLAATDIDLWEVNEAFAAVVLKFLRDMDLRPEDVNVNGGAIALGHPLGATGAMILGTLIDELERREARFGLATLCAGGGMGVATIVERV